MEAVALSPAELASARLLTVRSTNLRFEPATISVRPGEIIRVRLANDDSLLHDWAAPGVPGAHVATEAGTSAEAVFRAPGPGRYDIVCNVAGHREAGMVGQLIVE